MKTAIAMLVAVTLGGCVLYEGGDDVATGADAAVTDETDAAAQDVDAGAADALELVACETACGEFGWLCFDASGLPAPDGTCRCDTDDAVTWCDGPSM